MCPLVDVCFKPLKSLSPSSVLLFFAVHVLRKRGGLSCGFIQSVLAVASLCRVTYLHLLPSHKLVVGCGNEKPWVGFFAFNISFH